MSSSLISLLIIAAIFVPFFLRFIYDYFFSPARNPPTNRPLNNSPAPRQIPRRGLDISILENFPTMRYGDIKELKLGKGELICAICIEEFSDEDNLRLLPHCSHVFHIDCIDKWLDSKLTCPVCRQNLSEPTGSIDTDYSSANLAVQSGSATPAAISEEPRLPSPPLSGHWRCHSTGHEGEAEVDRYTLRLPENVWREILAGGPHRRAASLTSVPVDGEGRRRRGYRRGFSAERWSGRWSSFIRTLSEHWKGDGPSKRGGVDEQMMQHRRRAGPRRWHSSSTVTELELSDQRPVGRRGVSAGGWSGQWGSFLVRSVSGWRTTEEIQANSTMGIATMSVEELGESSGEVRSSEKGIEEIV